MIIRSFAELRRPARILPDLRQPERPQADVLAEAHAQRTARGLERERERQLAQFLPVVEDVAGERFQIPGNRKKWTPLGESVQMRTGAQLHVELAPVPEPEDKRLLNTPIKHRSIRKVPNGGRLKLTGAAHGAYRFHPDALGES